MQNEHNYLIHWLKKGEKAKYIDKVKLANGRWRYFYTQAELEAYKAQKKLSKGAGELANKAKNGLRGLKEGALDLGARAVVGVANRNDFIRDRIGGAEKDAARSYRNTANRSQNDANTLNREASQYSAKAASDSRRGTASGLNKIRDAIDPKYHASLERARNEANANRDTAEFKRSDARENAESASRFRARAAEQQKKYDSSILGKAEARVAADDRRKAQQSNSAKQTARKSSGESLGSKASRALGMAKEAATDRAAEALVGAASRSKTVRNAVGGQHEDNSREWSKMADASQRRSRVAEQKAHEDSTAAARQDRKYGSGGDRYRESARINREEAESAASNASTLRSKAADERRQYENSLLGRAKARVNRKGKKKSSGKKKSNRLNLSGGNYAVVQEAKIGR